MCRSLSCGADQVQIFWDFGSMVQWVVHLRFWIAKFFWGNSNIRSLWLSEPLVVYPVNIVRFIFWGSSNIGSLALSEPLVVYPSNYY